MTNVDAYEKGLGRGAQNYSSEEYFMNGHTACPGCGLALSFRQALKAVGNNAIVVVPPSCLTFVAGDFPKTSVALPLVHTSKDVSASVMSGIKAGLELKKDKDTVVLGWVNYSNAINNGFQNLVSAARRNEDVIYVCFDEHPLFKCNPRSFYNESAPSLNGNACSNLKGDIDFILSELDIPYLATAVPAYPHDYMDKFKQAKEIKGFKFIHVLSLCNPDYNDLSDQTIELMKLAVETNAFPLFEVRDGKWKVNANSKTASVKDYIDKENFGEISDEEINEIETFVDNRWNKIQKKCE